MLVEFCLYLFLSTIGCTAYYKWALNKQIVDTPNERSSHSHQPVRGMGVVFPVLFVIFSIYTWLTYKTLVSPLVPFINIGSLYVGIAILIAGITGFVDDRINLRSYVRLPLYLLSVIVGLMPLFQANAFYFWWFVVLSVLVVGVINTYNFMDGINGITGFYSIVLLATCLGLYYFYGDDFAIISELKSIVLIVIAFLFSFGVFNYRKTALAFLGDAGSVSIGLTICLLLVWTGYHFHRYDFVILLLVYGVDSVGTIILRLLRRENIFKAHRSHLYQDLVHIKGLSHLQVAFLYALMQVVINLVYMYNFDQENSTLFIALGLLIAVYVVSKKILGTLLFSSNTV